MLWSKFARRYMFSPKSHSVINIIAFVSLVAVAVPTAAMIILLAMFAGLTGTIDNLTRITDADIEIVAKRGGTFDAEAIAYDAIAEVQGVEHIASYVEQSVIATSAGRRVPMTIRGVESSYFDVIPLEEHLYKGDISVVATGDMILGASLASSLAAYGLGTEIELYALNRKQISTLLPMNGISRMTTRLGGVVNANAEINGSLAIADIERIQQLLNYEGRISAIAISLKPEANTEAVERSIVDIVGESFDVVTRSEQNASMNAILRMEKFAILLIGLLIILVATFSIVGSVIMLITEKQHDIYTLRAMGANRRLIHRIFVGEGGLLTLTGVCLGAMLGICFSLAQQHFGWVKIPGGGMLESYPVRLIATDVLLVVAIALVIGWVVSHLTVKAKLNRHI